MAEQSCLTVLCSQSELGWLIPFLAQAIQSINQALYQHVTNIREPEKKGLLTKMKKGTFYIGLFNYCHLVMHIDNSEDFSNDCDKTLSL